MTLETELKSLAGRIEAVDFTLGKLVELAQRLAYPPQMVEPPAGYDPELYGATQWRTGHLVQAPRDTVQPIDYMSGQWKRRDGHGVQDDLGSGVGKMLKTQQLDPWAIRSPEAKDV